MNATSATPAKHANSIGELAAQTGAVFDHTRRMNIRIGDWLVTMLRMFR